MICSHDPNYVQSFEFTYYLVSHDFQRILSSCKTIHLNFLIFHHLLSLCPCLALTPSFSFLVVLLLLIRQNICCPVHKYSLRYLFADCVVTLDSNNLMQCMVYISLYIPCAGCSKLIY